MPVVEKCNEIEFRLSQKSDIRAWKLIFISFLTTIGAAYKRITQKIRPVNKPIPDGARSGDIINQKAALDYKDFKSLPVIEEDLYADLLILKFSNITKGFRLTPERLDNIIIGNQLTEAEKDLLTAIFYNREVIFIQDFIEIGKVKLEVTSP